jgi:hypothetical protein
MSEKGDCAEYREALTNASRHTKGRAYRNVSETAGAISRN